MYPLYGAPDNRLNNRNSLMRRAYTDRTPSLSLDQSDIASYEPTASGGKPECRISFTILSKFLEFQ